MLVDGYLVRAHDANAAKPPMAFVALERRLQQWDSQRREQLLCE